jgi:hypothetical protein
MKATFIVTIALLSVGGCQKNSTFEDRLIGTWAAPALTIIYDRDPPATPPPLASEYMEITFTPEHKEIWRYRHAEGRAVARWHLEGDDLVFTTETESFWGPPGITKRETIKRITPDELVFIGGNVEGRWTRVR